MILGEGGHAITSSSTVGSSFRLVDILAGSEEGGGGGRGRRKGIWETRDIRGRGPATG